MLVRSVTLFTPVGSCWSVQLGGGSPEGQIRFMRRNPGSKCPTRLCWSNKNHDCETAWYRRAHLTGLWLTTQVAREQLSAGWLFFRVFTRDVLKALGKVCAGEVEDFHRCCSIRRLYIIRCHLHKNVFVSAGGFNRIRIDTERSSLILT